YRARIRHNRSESYEPCLRFRSIKENLARVIAVRGRDEVVRTLYRLSNPFVGIHNVIDAAAKRMQQPDVVDELEPCLLDVVLEADKVKAMDLLIRRLIDLDGVPAA